MAAAVTGLLLWTLVLGFPTPRKADPDYLPLVWSTLAVSGIVGLMLPGSRRVAVVSIIGVPLVLAIGTLVASYGGSGSGDPLWGVVVPYLVGLGVVGLLVAEAASWLASRDWLRLGYGMRV